MDPAIAVVKNSIGRFVEKVESASNGDYRLGLVDFGRGVTVHEPLRSSNARAVRNTLPDLLQTAGNSGQPEASDVALLSVVDNRAESDVPRRGQKGDFTVPWRSEATKIVVLVTDARPAGLDDDFDKGVDDVALLDAARSAADAGIVLGVFFVPNGNHEAQAAPILRKAAGLAGGRFFETLDDGSNLDEGLDLLVTACGEDRDGDGLFDLWETEGYDDDGDGTVDVDLAAMGANPEHKDLFVHVAWMSPDEAVPCYFVFWCPGVPDGPHPPDAGALTRVVEAFASAPVSNPDGESGIDLHIDAGAFTPGIGGIPKSEQQAGPIPEHVEVLLPEESDAPFHRLRERWFPAERDPIFTFALYAHGINADCTALLVRLVNKCWLGLAMGIPSDGFVLAEPTLTSRMLESAVFMHELGHTLGLRHGGSDHVNRKPNYLSVMNYSFTHREGLLPLVETQRVLDYSRWALGSLDEGGGLDEPGGIELPRETDGLEGFRTVRYCDGEQRRPRIEPLLGAKDWNCDEDSTDSDVAALIHGVTDDDRNYVSHTCSGRRRHGDKQMLCSQNDWEAVVFTGGVRGGLESEGQSYSEDGLTVEEYLDTPKTYAVALEGGGSFSAVPGAEDLQIVFALRNIGVEGDSYDIQVQAQADWEDPIASTPATVVLEAGQEELLPVKLSIPADAEAGEEVSLVLQADSRSAGYVRAAEPATLTLSEVGSLVPTEGALDVVPTQGRPGTPITLGGEGFAPSSFVMAWFSHLHRRLGVLRADDFGEANVELVVPRIAPDGYTLSMMGETEDGEPLLLKGRLRVLEDESANDGFEWPLWVLFGCGLLAFVGLVLVARRRRTGSGKRGNGDQSARRIKSS